MLAISVRDRPCSDFDSRSSSGRSTVMVPSSWPTVMGSATTWLRVPFGPFTVTVWPSMDTSTPDGTGTGSFPMRLMVSVLPSPDVGEDFPAYPSLGGLLVGQQPGRRRDDRRAEATEHARHAGRLGVHPQARLRDPADAGDAALAVLAVLQLDRQGAPGLALGGVDDLEAGDVALLLQNLGDVRLELRMRHLHRV